MKFKIKHEMMVMLKEYPEDTPILKNPVFRQFMYEVTFNLIHPSPFVQGKQLRPTSILKKIRIENSSSRFFGSKRIKNEIECVFNVSRNDL